MICTGEPSAHPLLLQSRCRAAPGAGLCARGRRAPSSKQAVLTGRLLELKCRYLPTACPSPKPTALVPVPSLLRKCPLLGCCVSLGSHQPSHSSPGFPLSRAARVHKRVRLSLVNVSCPCLTCGPQVANLWWDREQGPSLQGPHHSVYLQVHLDRSTGSGLPEGRGQLPLVWPQTPREEPQVSWPWSP